MFIITPQQNIVLEIQLFLLISITNPTLASYMQLVIFS